MRFTKIQKLIFGSALLLSANVPADYTDGLSTYESDDYKAAVNKIKPLLSKAMHKHKHKLSDNPGPYQY